MNLDNYIKKRVKYRIITADTCVYCDKAKKLMEKCALQRKIVEGRNN